METQKEEFWLNYFTWMIVVSAGLQWRVSAEIPTYAMEDRCGDGIDMSQFGKYSFVLTFSPSTSNLARNSCGVAVDTGSMWEVSWDRLMFQFLDFQNHGDGCISLIQVDRILSTKNISGDWNLHTKNISGVQGSYCGSNKPPIDKTFITDKYNVLVIKFQSSGGPLSRSSSSFKLVINVLHDGGSCSEYKCDNGNCIPRSLRCSQYNPCGDNSHCRPELPVKTIIFVVIGVVAGLILVVFAVKYYRYRRKLDDDDTETDDRNLTPIELMTNQPDGNQGQPTADSAFEQSRMLKRPAPPSYKDIMSDQKG